MPIAPLIAGWQQKKRNLPGPVQGASQPNWLPDGRLNVRVELLINGGWVDITDRVRVGGVAEGITIDPRGRPDWQSRIQPTTASFTINNLDGVFSDRNPNSPYFGRLGRNTQCRIWVGSNLRFSGEIAEFPQHWNEPGTDVWVPVQAAGITRRLSKGAKPLPSPIYREVLSTVNLQYLTAYWPMEDGADATQLSSPVDGINDIVPSGTVDYASYTGFIGSAPTPKLQTGAKLTCVIPAFTAPLGFKSTLLFHLPAEGVWSAGQKIASWASNGTVKRYELHYDGVDGPTGNPVLSVTAYGAADSVLGVVLAQWSNVHYDEPVAALIQIEPSGSDISMVLAFQRMQITDSTFLLTGATISGASVGSLTSVVIAPNADFNDVAVGHLTVGITPLIFLSGLGTALIGNAGEQAVDRIRRLCVENNVPCRIVGDGDTFGGLLPSGEFSTTMGVQTIDTLLNLLQSCADVDKGFLYEPRDLLGIGYRTRRSAFNQSGITLDYSAGHLSEIPLPVDDDQLSLNRVTVSRPSGSSATYELTTGRLSTQDPPDGIGVYDEQVTNVLYADIQCVSHASWLVALGTIDESRYPTVSVNLVTDPFRQDEGLTNAVLALDSGIYLSLTNLPSWLPPDLVELLVQGTSEELTVVEWKFKFNTTPYAPYRIVVLNDSTYGRLADDGTSTLTSDQTSSDTSWSVTTTGGALWSTTDVPYNARVGGEVVTVTAVSGSTSPQTFTVTRSVNGIVKAHSAGDLVRFVNPLYLAL